MKVFYCSRVHRSFILTPRVLLKTENSLLENNEEQVLTSDIERDLGDVRQQRLCYNSLLLIIFAQLHECIQQMRQGNGSILSSQQEAWIKRYYEIHFDYSTEFRNTAVRTK